jgi:DNA-binding transcriptional LysR family regulator
METPLINPARIDFVTLRLYVAVAQSGSITKGAEACHLALSAASRRLAEFERSVGAKLLERSAKGISLTAAGHTAVQHSMSLFQGFEQFSAELHDYSQGVRGHVRLWANMSALTEFLPATLSSFLRDHPNIRMEVEEQVSGDIVRALIEGVADVGVFAENVPSHSLSVDTYKVDQLVAVCSRRHPLAKRRRVDFRDCLQFEFVGLNRGSSLLELMLRAASEANLSLRLRVQVRSFDAMCQMISAGLGIGVLPLATCRSQLSAMGLKAVRLNDAWTMRRLLVGVNTQAGLSPAVALFFSHLTAEADQIKATVPKPTKRSGTGGRTR